MNKQKSVKIFYPLKNSYHTLRKIEEQFNEKMTERGQSIVKKINKEKHRDLFYLYAEYKSLRKVSEETNINKETVRKLVNEIKKRCI